MGLAVDRKRRIIAPLFDPHSRPQTNDRQHGGHLLDCAAAKLRLRIEFLAEFHLALPGTEGFLKADFSKNTAEELAYAEHSH
jgi:acetolactate decarboxylase